MKKLIVGLVILMEIMVGGRREVWAEDFPIQKADFTFSTPTIAGKYNWTGAYYTVNNLPKNINFRGMEGTLSLSAAPAFSGSMGVVLFQLGYYPGGCPATGYEDSNFNYSQYGNLQTLQRFVLQINGPGTVTLPVNFTLPYKTPITTEGCLTLYYGGGDPWHAQSINMNGNFKVLYDTQPGSMTPPQLTIFDSESCVGLRDGCLVRSMSINPDQAFATYHQYSTEGFITAINGNLDHGSFGVPGYTQMPSIGWTSASEFYLVKNCTLPESPTTSGVGLRTYGPSTTYFNPPVGSTLIFKDAVETTSGPYVSNNPIHINNIKVPITKNDCLLEITKFNGNGAMRNETQLSVQIVPQLSGLIGDVNGDSVVNLVDFSLWKQEYSKKVTTKKADFNNDGIVNLVDFSIWKREYLKT